VSPRARVAVIAGAVCVVVLIDHFLTARMHAAVRLAAEIPLGSDITAAQAILEKQGFSCRGGVKIISAPATRRGGPGVEALSCDDANPAVSGAHVFHADILAMDGKVAHVGTQACGGAAGDCPAPR
jgi:hypothetical protein